MSPIPPWLCFICESLRNLRINAFSSLIRQTQAPLGYRLKGLVSIYNQQLLRLTRGDCLWLSRSDITALPGGFCGAANPPVFTELGPFILGHIPLQLNTPIELFDLCLKLRGVLLYAAFFTAIVSFLRLIVLWSYARRLYAIAYNFSMLFNKLY